MSGSQPPAQDVGLLRSIGPAIIVASVVLGPGSILSASKIGHQHGYQMTWVLWVAVVLMVGMTALSARLGILLDGTLCEELARRAGRPFALAAGLAVFLITSCFQFGNNLGVLAAIEPFYEGKEGSGVLPLLLIVNLNVLVIVALFGFKTLYLPVERLMKLLVGLMVGAFAVNLLLARPEFLKILGGMVPQLPDEALDTLLPRWQEAVVENGKVVQQACIVDKLLPVTALFGTTFSVAGAFYQSYLVRQKGWTAAHLRQGLIDSTVGIVTLGLITLMIMVTAAAILHGNPEVPQLRTTAQVAVQLKPAFGTVATILFCLGIFAGAFSSFLVNAMIGGSVLADSLGLGGYIDQRWPKLFTVAALLIGLNVAILVHLSGKPPVNLIIFAQAMTVLGLPVLAAALLWLASRRDGEVGIPLWLKLLGFAGLAVTVILAIRLGVRLILRATTG